MTFLGGNAGFIKPRFSVRDLPHLELWLAADRAGLTINNYKVSQWSDLSGHGRHFTQATGTKQPTWVPGGLNGLPYLSADGTSDTMSSTWIAPTTMTLFAVCRTNRNNASLVNQVETVFTSTSGSFSGLRLELFNYFGSTTQRAVFAQGNGTTQANKNGASSPYSVDVTEGEWHIASCTYENINDTQIASKLFSTFDESLFGQVDLAELIICSDVMSPGQRRDVEIYLAEKWGITGHVYNAARTIVCQGDSLTEGYGVSAADQYPYQLFGLYSSNLANYYMLNDGVGLATLNTFDQRATLAPDGVETLTYKAGTKVYLMLWGGSNDLYLDSLSADDVFLRLIRRIQRAKASNKYYKILVGTTLPRGGTTNYQAYNALITGSWGILAAAGADKLVDFTTNAAFDNAADSSDTTYYQSDTTHLTAAGMAIAAGMVKTALDTIP